MRTPRNMRDLANYLRDEFDSIEMLARYGLADVRAEGAEAFPADGLPEGQDESHFVAMQVADMVEEAGRVACRFGAPLVCEPQTITEPRKGLEIIGRLMVWTESQLPPPELLTAAEVAAMLGVSVRTVWRKVSAGSLPRPIQMGGLTKWRRIDVEEWINGQCV